MHFSFATSSSAVQRVSSVDSTQRQCADSFIDDTNHLGDLVYLLLYIVMYSFPGCSLQRGSQLDPVIPTSVTNPCDGKMHFCGLLKIILSCVFVVRVKQTDKYQRCVSLD